MQTSRKRKGINEKKGRGGGGYLLQLPSRKNYKVTRIRKYSNGRELPLCRTWEAERMGGISKRCGPDSSKRSEESELPSFHIKHTERKVPKKSRKGVTLNAVDAESKIKDQSRKGEKRTIGALGRCTLGQGPNPGQNTEFFLHGSGRKQKGGGGELRKGNGLRR